MKSFKEIAGVSALDFFEYHAKCLVGVSIGYLLYKAFPRNAGFYLWLLISILLSITHDNSSKVAYDRMKGNIVGSVIGLMVFFLHDPPNLLTLCIGVAAVVTVCFRLNLIGVSRIALVAFIIVMVYEQSAYSWKGAVYRVVAVMGGCLTGLMINHVFRKLTDAVYRPVQTDGTRAEQAKVAATVDGGE